MKTKILITIYLFCIAFTVQAQEYEYIPLVNEEHVWSYCNVVRTGLVDYNVTYAHFQIKGDTIIHDISYKKVYDDCSTNPTNYEAAIREEDKKVYVLRRDEQQEKLIYDFNMEVGDSIIINEYHYYKVTKIDTVEIAGKLRKRYDYLNSHGIIEGIGSLNGNFFLYPHDPIALYEIGICFNYQKKGTELIHKTDQWYFNENDCEPPSAIQPPSASSTDYEVRIQEGNINILFPMKETVQISLSDIEGKLYYHSPLLSTTEVTIPSQSFSQGIYLLKVLDIETNQVNVRKIILHPKRPMK